ncbi:MAG: hypothetical protein RL268_1889 [Pseudomonadota bacterium]
MSYTEYVDRPKTNGMNKSDFVDLGPAEKVTSIATLRPTLLRRDLGSVWACDVELDPDPEMLIQDLLPAGGMTTLWGDPGCGKSFLAAAMGFAIATGRDFLGKPVQQGGVVYVAAEGGRGFKKRIVAYRERFGLPARTPFALIPTAVDLCTEDHETEALLAEVRGLGERAEAPIRLIVIDTLARSLGGGTHGGKDREKKTRGHSSFFAAIDTGIEVTANATSGLKTATVRKQKDGEDGGEITFKLEVVDLLTPGGETVTSCVVVPAEPDEAMASPEPDRARRLTGVNAIALDALRKAVAEHGTSPPACEHIPAHIRAVSPDLWRRYFYQMRTIETADANRMAFKRSATELQNRGLIGCWGEYAWPTR